MYKKNSFDHINYFFHQATKLERFLYQKDLILIAIN